MSRACSPPSPHLGAERWTRSTLSQETREALPFAALQSRTAETSDWIGPILRFAHYPFGFALWEGGLTVASQVNSAVVFGGTSVLLRREPVARADRMGLVQHQRSITTYSRQDLGAQNQISLEGARPTTAQGLGPFERHLGIHQDWGKEELSFQGKLPRHTLCKTACARQLR